MSRRPSGKQNAEVLDMSETDYSNTSTGEKYHHGHVEVAAGGMGSCLGGGNGQVLAGIVLFIIVFIIVWLLLVAFDHDSLRKKDCKDIDHGKALFCAFIITIILFIIFWLIAYVAKSCW